MTEQTMKDDRALIGFWDRAFTLTEEDKKELTENGAGDLKSLAPSEKLYLAAASLGSRKKVLDYGCGSAWAGIIAAKCGCPDVTAADPAPRAAESAQFYAALYGVQDSLKACRIGRDWLGTVPENTYDGLICSNVLDVVPPETAEEIIAETTRIVTSDARAVIGLNYYLSPDTAAAKGLGLTDGCMLYIDGILRLVSRTDEEWAALFSPFYTVEKLEYFAWPGEQAETRRLFTLKKR